MDNEQFANNNEIILPGMGSDVNQQSDLITKGVEEALMKKEIKSVIVKSDDDIVCPAYLLDMSNVTHITEEALRAIQGLLSGGDTAMYIKNKSMTMGLGYGDDTVLYPVLDSVLKQLFNGQCVVYINRGNGFKILRENDVYAVRLNL